MAVLRRTDLARTITCPIQSGNVVPAQPIMQRIQRLGQSGNEAQQVATGGNQSSVTFQTFASNISDARDGRDYLSECAGYFVEIETQVGTTVTVYCQSPVAVEIRAGKFAYAGTTYSHLVTAQMTLEAQP